MSSQPSDDKPQSVQRAVVCLWISAGLVAFLTVASWAGLQAIPGGAGPTFEKLISLALLALVAIKLGAGRGWVRWLFVVIYVFGPLMFVVLSFLAPHTFRSLPTVLQGSGIAQFALQTAALVFMFSTTSRQRIAIMAFFSVVVLVIVGAMLRNGIDVWLGLLARPASVATKTVDASNEAYSFTWPARDGIHPAPPLAMRIEPADVDAWWWTGGPSRRTGETGDGPKVQLLIEVLVPSADGAPLAELAPLCEQGPSIFAGCKHWRTRVLVNRNEADGDIHDILLGKSVRPQGERPSRNGRRDLLREFWTKLEGQPERMRFLHWVCAPKRTKAELEQSSTDAASHLTEATAPSPLCFEPPHWWERMVPGLFGYQKHKVLFHCSVDAGCPTYFLFHRRLVHFEDKYLPLRNATEYAARMQLVATAWQVLNRQHAAALTTPAPTAELAEAKVQLAACQALGEEVDRWHPIDPEISKTGPRLSARESDKWNELSISCLRAGDIARRLVKVAPAEAIPILSDVTEVLWNVEDWIPLRQEILQKSLFVALKAIGKADSPAMVNALSKYASRSRAGHRDVAFHEDTLLQGWSLVRKLNAGVSEEDYDNVREALGRHYSLLKKPESVLALYQESIADLERQFGTESVRLIKPLQHLNYLQFSNEDYSALKPSLDRLRAVWLAQPEWQKAAGDSLAAKQREEQIGFDIVYRYRVYAFKQREFAAVVPLISEIVTRMERTLGSDNSYVREAHFHQREVVAGKAVDKPEWVRAADGQFSPGTKH